MVFTDIGYSFIEDIDYSLHFWLRVFQEVAIRCQQRMQSSKGLTEARGITSNVRLTIWRWLLVGGLRNSPNGVLLRTV